MQQVRLLPWWCMMAWLLPLANQSSAQSDFLITISVSAGTTPIFSWTPDSTIGRLIIEEGAEKIWGAETAGANTYRSPIRYGVHPDGASEDEAANPLLPGHTYKVSLFRWISVDPESLQLVAAQVFTPSPEFGENGDNPNADVVESAGETEPEEDAPPAKEADAENQVGSDPIEPVPSEEAAPQANTEEREDGAAAVEAPAPQVDEPATEEEDEPAADEPLLERPTLRVSELPLDFKFDGTINGPTYWAVTDSIDNLIMVEPEEGGVPTGRTVVKVLVNQNDLVLAARCYDHDPQGIVSYSKARDIELDEEDNILFVLDTFLDGRSGYVFAVNPSGSRFDGLVIEQGEDVNSDWDTIWEANTAIDSAGWYAEIRIPIKSLGFKKGLTTWGFNVERRVQRLQESSRWSGAKLDYEIFQTSRAGLLTGLPQFDLGLGLSIRGSLVGSAGRPGPGENTQYDGDFSLDVTQKIGSNLSSALTINTDFAETEVDVRQVNVTRFPQFFPEKRSFFLEGADIFQFGVALDEDTMIPFFSRRIGLIGQGEEDQVEVPINAGGKINGRVGNTNIGALAVNTRKVDSLNVGDADEEINIHVPNTTMGALRISQNILEESAVGMLATFGDQRGHSGTWLAGVDFVYRTSNFLNERNFVLSVWGLLNHGKDLEGEDLSGDKSALGLRVDYPNDFLDLTFTSIRIGDGFKPALGFVPRNDLHFWDFAGELNLRPQSAWLRRVFFKLEASLYNKLDNSEWESYEVAIQPLGVLLESGERFEAAILPQGDRPPEAFEIASGVDIPSGEFSGAYTWLRYLLVARSAEKRKISAEVNWEFGDYYNGDLSTIEARLSLKPSSFFILEFTGERNSGKMMALPEDVEEEEAVELVQTKFKEELFGVRVLLNFSANLQLSSFTQYDNEGKELGTNNRLRWTFDPLGDLFVVYNHNLIRNEENEWKFVSNNIPIKIQYTRRF